MQSTAKRLLGVTESRECGYISHRLRSSLALLASKWFGSDAPRSNHFHRDTDARPTGLRVGELAAEVSGATAAPARTAAAHGLGRG
jgi:hypothetical protein